MNRETALMLALGALAVAAALVSIGSWILLVVESRRRRDRIPHDDAEAG